MFKKTLLAAVAVMFSSTPAVSAPSSPYRGTLTGGFVYSGIKAEASLPGVGFHCDGGAYGQFDMCITNVLLMTRPSSNVRMAVKIDPRLGSRYKRIIMRYRITRSVGANPGGYQSTTVMDENNVALITAQLYGGAISTVTRISEDGGQTWSKATIDYERQ